MLFKSFISLLFISSSVFATNKFMDQLTASLGMISVNYTETDEGIGGDEAANGSNSFLSVDVDYQFYSEEERSYYVRAYAPFFSSSGAGYFGANIGMNFYFNSFSSKLKTKLKGDTLSYDPKMRYFWGGEAGAGYLVYLTDSAKKGDVLAELGGHGGMIYNINKDYGIRGKLSFSQGIGGEVTAMIMKIFFGFNINTGF